MIFRTVFRETCSSRQISLIVLPRTKNSRRTLAIVSTPFIPHPPIQFKGRAGLLELTKGGQFWTPIPPLRGSTFHADPQTHQWQTCLSSSSVLLMLRYQTMFLSLEFDLIKCKNQMTAHKIPLFGEQLQKILGM